MKQLITSWDDVPVIIDLPFASELLGLTVDDLKRKSRSQRFPAFKVGERSWRVKKDDLLVWIDQQKNKPALRVNA